MRHGDAEKFPPIPTKDEHEYQEAMARLRARTTGDRLERERKTIRAETVIAHYARKPEDMPPVRFTQSDVDALNARDRCTICGAGYVLAAEGLRIDTELHDRVKHQAYAAHDSKIARRYTDATTAATAQKVADDLLRPRRARRDWGDEGEDAP